MTKRRSSGSGKQVSVSLTLLLTVLLVAGILYAGDLVGLIDVDWPAFLDEASAILLGKEGRPQQPVVEEVSGDWYQLYFSSPRYPDEAATRVSIIADGLVDAIESAQDSLDIAIYELDLEEVGDAILAARDRGVEVRMVTDSDTLEEEETLIRLDREGIPIVPDERGPIMHNKFVVIDGASVWTGSWNFTPNGTYRNNNNAILIQSTQLAANYSAEFEEMFEDETFGPTSPENTRHPRIQLGDALVETCFAPEDECGTRIVERVEDAKESVRFMAFSFTHDEIGQAIVDRAEAGLAVQGVFETRGSETEYSEYTHMERAGLDVLQDGNPYILHHKVIIIDEETVVLGSFNFSANADESNDENVLIIDYAPIAQEYTAEFQRVYQQALNPPTRD